MSIKHAFSAISVLLIVALVLSLSLVVGSIYLGVSGAMAREWQDAILLNLNEAMDSYYQAKGSTPKSLQDLLAFYTAKNGNFESKFPGATNKLYYFQATQHSAIIVSFRKHAKPRIDEYSYPGGCTRRAVVKDKAIEYW